MGRLRSANRAAFVQIRTGRGDVFWLDRNPDGGCGWRDGADGSLRLIASLRVGQFDAIVLLHHGRSVAFALCAGIPERYGHGVPSTDIASTPVTV
jgi:hypothetical protein